MQTHFEMPLSIGDGRIDFALKLMDLARSCRGNDVGFRLDWRKTKAILPAGHAVLACITDTLIECGVGVKSVGIAKDLQLLPSVQCLKKIAPGAPPFQPRDYSFETDDFLLRGNITALDVSFMERVGQKFCRSLSEEILFAAKLIVNDLVQNTVDHSTAERYYVYGGRFRNEFHVGVLDMGITIPAKLEQKYSAADDLAYLELSLKKGVGTRSLRPGGLGLYYLFDFLKQNEGRLTILSRRAQIRRYFKTRRSQKNISRYPLWGTWCFARFPLEKKL